MRVRDRKLHLISPSINLSRSLLAIIFSNHFQLISFKLRTMANSHTDRYVGGGDMRESRIISTETDWQYSKALSSAQFHDHQQQSSKKSSSSSPVNIPDWSRILLRSDYYYYKQQQQQQQQRRNEEEEEENNNNGLIRIPPHELVAKQQMARNGNGTASFSVHEGVGRTLKGRDMCRVRNAIWEITAGFQD